MLTGRAPQATGLDAWTGVCPPAHTFNTRTPQPVNHAGHRLPNHRRRPGRDPQPRRAPLHQSPRRPQVRPVWKPIPRLQARPRTGRDPTNNPRRGSRAARAPHPTRTRRSASPYAGYPPRHRTAALYYEFLRSTKTILPIHDRDRHVAHEGQREGVYVYASPPCGSAPPPKHPTPNQHTVRTPWPTGRSMRRVCTGALWANSQGRVSGRPSTRR